MKYLRAQFLIIAIVAASFSSKASAYIALKLEYSLEWQYTIDSKGESRANGLRPDVDVIVYAYDHRLGLDMSKRLAAPTEFSISWSPWDWNNEVDMGVSTSFLGHPVILSGDAGVILEADRRVSNSTVWIRMENSDAWSAWLTDYSDSTTFKIRYPEMTSEDWWTDPDLATDVYAGSLTRVSIESDGKGSPIGIYEEDIVNVPDANAAILLILALAGLALQRTRPCRRF